MSTITDYFLKNPWVKASSFSFVSSNAKGFHDLGLIMLGVHLIPKSLRLKLKTKLNVLRF